MNKKQLAEKLNGDLINEYTHMHFYLQSSLLVEGVHRHEISEWLLEHAQSEFKHIQEFAKVIIGLGGVPVVDHKEFNFWWKPEDIFEEAHHLESQVVTNYVHRMEEIDKDIELSLEDKKYVILFLEDQLLDSRSDLDEIKQFMGKSNAN